MPISRRMFLTATGLTAASSIVSADPITLPGWLAPTETEENTMPAPLPPEQRVGYAIVGLGRLALEEILPAFAQSKKAKVTALVSGDRAKAEKVAGQYGAKHILDYKTFDRLRDLKDVGAVYIVLPNGMHAEFTVRAAAAGKHVLCEKPMANSVSECQQMIDACQKARTQLMIAYRMQYEPYNRFLIKQARSGAFGKLKSFVAANGQNQADPQQWRLKKALAGGGALPDVGIYCLNAARYLSGEEPNAVSAMIHTTPNDPRFAEVEEQVNFMLRFPSGFLASATTSYGFHDAKSYRLLGERAWAELDPAFPYRGQTLHIGRKSQVGTGEDVTQVRLTAKDQFALEVDHFAECVKENRRPHTPGEEGMQDMRLIAAIYQAAAEGKTITLPTQTGLDIYRGPIA